MSDALVLLPDAEVIVSSFLRATPEVAAIVGSRVYTALPAGDLTFPLLRVSRIGSLPIASRPLWAEAVDLQVEAYGGPKAVARTLLDTVRAAMAQRLRGRHPAGAVAAVAFRGASYVPDADVPSDTGRPRPRYVATVAVTVHP